MQIRTIDPDYFFFVTFPVFFFPLCLQISSSVLPELEAMLHLTGCLSLALRGK